MTHGTAGKKSASGFIRGTFCIAGDPHAIRSQKGDGVGSGCSNFSGNSEAGIAFT
ncbi:MAG: hypothetical protein ACLVB1_00295 [Blautia obeum]